MKDLETQRQELEKKYQRMFEAHTAKYSKFISSEGEYRDSAQKVKDIYAELCEVSEKLGSPIPVWI